MKSIVYKFWIVAPWILNFWIFAKAINGDINGLLAFFFLAIGLPLAAMLNIIVSVYFKGRELFSQLQPEKQAKAKTSRRVKAVNYADMPWWNLKKWLNR